MKWLWFALLALVATPAVAQVVLGVVLQGPPPSPLLLTNDAGTKILTNDGATLDLTP